MIGLDEIGQRAERRVQAGFAAVVDGVREIAELNPDYAQLLVHHMGRVVVRTGRRAPTTSPRTRCSASRRPSWSSSPASGMG